MAKSTGLGSALWVDEFILSNDIQSLTLGNTEAVDLGFEDERDGE